MFKPKTKVGKNAFKKAIAGGKSYLPAKSAQILKKAGMSGLLYKPSVTRAEATRAIKALQAEKALPAKDPADVWKRASTEEQKVQDLAAEDKRQRNLRYIRSTEIADELAKEEAEMKQQVTGANSKKYLGKLTDEIEEERQGRDEKIAAARASREQMLNAGAGKTKQSTPKPAEPADMFSGM